MSTERDLDAIRAFLEEGWLDAEPLPVGANHAVKRYLVDLLAHIAAQQRRIEELERPQGSAAIEIDLNRVEGLDLRYGRIANDDQSLGPAPPAEPEQQHQAGPGSADQE